MGCWVGLMLLSAAEGSEAGLFWAIGLFGLSLASVVPATLALAETLVQIGRSLPSDPEEGGTREMLMGLSATATSLIVVGASFGEMVFPVVVGHLMETMGAPIFVLVGAFASTAVIAQGGLILVAGKYVTDPQHRLPFQQL